MWPLLCWKGKKSLWNWASLRLMWSVAYHRLPGHLPSGVLLHLAITVDGFDSSSEVWELTRDFFFFSFICLHPHVFLENSHQAFISNLALVPRAHLFELLHDLHSQLFFEFTCRLSVWPRDSGWILLLAPMPRSSFWDWCSFFLWLVSRPGGLFWFPLLSGLKLLPDPRNFFFVLFFIFFSLHDIFLSFFFLSTVLVNPSFYLSSFGTVSCILCNVALGMICLMLLMWVGR